MLKSPGRDHRDCQFQEDLDYKGQIQKGVFSEFWNKDDIEVKKPLDFSYPKLGVFMRGYATNVCSHSR